MSPQTACPSSMQSTEPKLLQNSTVFSRLLHPGSFRLLTLASMVEKLQGVRH